MDEGERDSHGWRLARGCGRERRALLVVENSPANCQRLRSLLGDDFSFQFVDSEEEALLMAIASPPDVVLFDGSQVLGDRCSLCRRMKSVRTLLDVPLIFLTPEPFFN